MLIDIAAKGGNLALNVAPQPDGRLPMQAYKRMDEMGAWLKLYGDAIYGTRICAPYVTDDFASTQKAKENKVYAFCLADDINAKNKLNIPYADKKAVKVINMANKSEVSFVQNSTGIELETSTMAPSETFGGEFIAEVFEISVKS